MRAWSAFLGSTWKPTGSWKPEAFNGLPQEGVFSYHFLFFSDLYFFDKESIFYRLSMFNFSKYVPMKYQGSELHTCKVQKYFLKSELYAPKRWFKGL